MGIQDRDYMRRPPEDDGHDGSSPDSKLEELFSVFLRRHSKHLFYFGIGLVVLFVVALLVTKVAGKSP